MKSITCGVLIIGGGPAGYVCAIRAGQLGLDVVLVEEAAVGGTCLNVGCIPSKALIHAADAYDRLREQCDAAPLGISASAPRLDFGKTMRWKDGIVERLTGGVGALLARVKVRTVAGHATIKDGKTAEVETDAGTVEIRAGTLVLATGSDPAMLDALPFGGPVVTSSEALSLGRVPGRLVVVGAGYIGLEIGTAYAKLGADVTIVESALKILPRYDAELSDPVARRLRALGVTVVTGATVGGLTEAGDAVSVETPDGGIRLPFDCVLVASGRRPRLSGFGLESLRLSMTGLSLTIDGQCRTSMRGVFAIGDVTGEPMLAHRAMAQGELVAQVIAGGSQVWDRRCVPAVCFTDPEIVTAGLSPDEASDAGIAVRVGRFPLRANGRAMTLERDDGLIRVVIREADDAVIGLQAVGAGTSELSAAFATTIETGCRVEDLSAIIQTHPTLSEAIGEAARQADGAAIHI